MSLVCATVGNEDGRQRSESGEFDSQKPHNTWGDDTGPPPAAEAHAVGAERGLAQYDDVDDELLDF